MYFSVSKRALSFITNIHLDMGARIDDLLQRAIPITTSKFLRKGEQHESSKCSWYMVLTMGACDLDGIT
jgi:hypothetical protein